MKKLLLLFLTITNYTASGQLGTYHPLLDSVNRWSYVINLYPVSPPRTSPCSYPFWQNIMVTTTDTTINSNTFKKLYGDCYLSSCLCLFGFIREDTAARRVFFQDVLNSPEVLLYDFSMQQGDSISIIRSWQNTSVYYTLDTIKSTVIQIGQRNEFFLSCHSCTQPDTIRWTESVGDLENLVYPYADAVIGGGGPLSWPCTYYPHLSWQYLICFDHNQKVYYDSCSYQSAISSGCYGFIDTCGYYLICGAISELTLQSLNIYPNPFHTFAKLELVNRGEIDGQLKIFDTMGRFITQEVIKGESTIIHRNELVNGIYFYQLVSDNGPVAGGRFVVE